MLTHAAPQLTPAQLIDAGRRAEAQGRPDLAVQFYRYLTDFFAEAVEAAEAHNALGRIGAAQSLPLIAKPQPARIAHAAANAAPAIRRRLVLRRDPYRTGRVLTAVLGAVGWLVAAACAAIVPGFLLLRAEQAGLSSVEVLPVAGGAAGGLILGCGVVLASHIARAVFDQANAVHYLLALERERLDVECRSVG